MDPELTALTQAAATTMVTLLAKSAWEHAVTAISGLWRRVHPERAETVEADLAECRTELLAAQEAGNAQAEQALIDEWHNRLRRLVAANPELADELRRIVAELHLLPPDTAPQCTTITMQATAFDDSRVNQAGHDLHVTER